MFELGSVAVLIWGMLFGAIGFGYFLYGKKQRPSCHSASELSSALPLLHCQRVRFSRCRRDPGCNSIFCASVK